MNDLLEINPKKTVQKICHFLQKEFRQRKKQVAVLGISGGIDSAVCAFLCHRANLKLYALNLPYGRQDIQESLLVEKALCLSKKQILTINIKKTVDAQIRLIEEKIELTKLDKGNIMARQRMIVQYAVARKLNGLVIGTENLSEYYLAYFTLHGDQACDLAPIGNLFKTQVRQLAKYLKLPEKIIQKPPSAELWEGQTDEAELGFKYAQADPVIYLFKVEKKTSQQIINMGYNKSLVNHVLGRIRKTEYKRQPPPKCLFF